MRTGRGIIAFLLLFAAVALYQTSPHLIQNVNWDAPTLLRAVSYLIGGLGLVSLFSMFSGRGKGDAPRKAKG